MSLAASAAALESTNRRPRSAPRNAGITCASGLPTLLARRDRPQGDQGMAQQEFDRFLRNNRRTDDTTFMLEEEAWLTEDLRFSHQATIKRAEAREALRSGRGVEAVSALRELEALAGARLAGLPCVLFAGVAG